MMRRFMPEEVRNEVLEHLTDTEKKELGHSYYLLGVLAAVIVMANFGLWMLFWPEYGGVGLLLGTVLCFIAVMVPIGLLVRSGYEAWLRGTGYAKSLNTRPPEHRMP